MGTGSNSYGHGLTSRTASYSSEKSGMATAVLAVPVAMALTREVCKCVCI